MAQKYDKVYIVHCGLVNKDGDNHNWSSYKVIARDADSAIEQVKPKFKKGEYVESVELVTVLD